MENEIIQKIRNAYMELDACGKVRAFRMFRNKIMEDETIRTDDQGLLDFTDLVINCDDAIVIANDLKEEIWTKTELIQTQDTTIETLNSKIEKFNEKYQDKINHYEQRIEELESNHNKEKVGLMKKKSIDTIENDSEQHLIDIKDIPGTISDFVLLQCEKIREFIQIEKKSLHEIKEFYIDVEKNGATQNLREFSKLIQIYLNDDIIKPKTWKPVENKIIKELWSILEC